MRNLVAMRMTRIISILATLCLIAGTLVILAPGAGAAEKECKVKNVTQGTQKSPDLQAAIDTAEPGDTIRVKGTCVGNFAISQDLNLVGKRNKTTLDGHGSGTVLSVISADVTLTNLLIMGGNAESGGGIANDSGTVTLLSSEVSGNHALWGGGGILNWNGGLVVSGSTVAGNTASNGGGIHSINGDLTVIGSQVSENTASDSGGGIYSGGGSLAMSDSAVKNNEVEEQFGGGIAVWEGTVELNGSSIDGNAAYEHGGGFFSYNADVLLNGTSVIGNYSGAAAGMDLSGDSSANSTVTLIESEVSNNIDVEGPIGGPAGISTNVTLTLIDTAVNHNEGAAGLYVAEEGEVALIRSMVSGNTSSSEGVGGIENDGTVTLTQSVVSANTGRNWGGGIANAGILALIDSEVTGNTVSQDPGGAGGGGIFNFNFGWGIGQVLTLAGSSSITGNAATMEGGGIYVSYADEEGLEAPTTQAADGSDLYQDPITGETLPAWTGSVTGNSPDQCYPPLTLGGVTCGA